MQLAARSYIAAAAALAASTIIAVTPGVCVKVRPAQLTSSASDLLSSDPLLNLQADELGSDATLVTNELASNADVVAGEESFESDIASAFPGLFDTPGPTAFAATAVGVVLDGGLVGVFNRLFDVSNLFLGTSENVFNSLIGADNFDPATINSSLLIDSGLTAISGGGTVADIAQPISAPFLSGQIGGFEGITGNSLDAEYATIGFVNTQFGLTLPDLAFQAVVTLGDDLITFNDALVADELSFNTNLLNEELAAEAAAFGGNESALDGSVDRMINIGNLFLSTGENSFNSLIGAEFNPADLTQSLLTGTSADVFDTGDLGGLQGIVDQSLALSVSLADLTPGDITSAFAPGAFDTTAFTAAIGDLFDVSAFSNLTPDVATLSTDLGTIFTSMF